ncbi:phage tail protein [Robbsia andropogonis]|uniref:phage tail protein n=1 Tax=Robbsia andropogonis TaxID=28092 RepID=UPI003D2125B5
MSATQMDIENQYPIPLYRFKVTVGDLGDMAVAGVSGLELAFDTIEYRDGAGGWFRMPGQRQTINLTLRRGLFKGDKKLYDWINSITLNRVEKRDISVSLTNEVGTEILVAWNVANAFPTKLSAPSFDATSNEIAVAEMSLMADRVTMSMP